MSVFRISRRRLLALAGAAVASGATLPLGSASASTARLSQLGSMPFQRSGFLRTAEPFGAPSLDPGAQVNTYTVQSGIAEALMRFTPGGEIVPWLAESVRPLDPLHWSIQLRPGITFWNGRTVDSEAVRQSMERSVALNPSTGTLLDLDHIETPDALTAVIVTRNPNAAVPSQVAGFRLLIHDAEYAAQVGNDAFAEAPMATGPYIPTEFRVREYMRLRRNDVYWQGMPALDEIEMRAVADANARLAAVLSNDVDVARQIAPQGLAQARSSGLTVYSTATAFMYQIYFNNTKAPFDDVNVRRAVSMSVDRDALVNRVIGSGTAATGPYPSFFPFADPRPLPFDPDGARALLDSAGWLVGSDGIRARDGQRLEFTLTTYPQRPELGLMATAIQSMLAEIGMSVSQRSVEQITPVVNSRDYEATMYALQTAPNADPGYALNIVFSRWGDQNVQLGYASDRIEDVTQRLNLATDPGQRQMLALEAQEILRDEAPAVFLLSPGYNTVVNSRVQNYQPHPFDFYVVHPTLSVA